MTGAAPVELASGGAEAAPRGAARRGVARVLYSPAGRFRRVVFQPGDAVRFGRDERADVAIADDELRPVHFELFFDGVAFFAREIAGAGRLMLDGRRVAAGEVRSGGFVAAGRTTISLYLEARTPPASADPARGAAEARARLAPLRDAGDLYGVFDAARDPRVMQLLNESIEEHASLYEGAEAAVIDEFAPYLVRFAKDSRLLERLVDEGWGGAWGIYFVSHVAPKDVRRHWRRFLMVLDEPSNKKMYFRFYDPRVLREFFPIATPRQQAELAADLDGIFVEAEDTTLVELRPSATGGD